MSAQQILKSIVKNESIVKFHEGWGYYIETKFESLRMIGLIDKGSHFELSFFFGETQKQSRAFYSHPIYIEHLQNPNWSLIANFHISSTFKNLLWLDSGLSPSDYIDFWRKNLYLLRQNEVNDLPRVLSVLAAKQVIKLDSDVNEQIKNVIYSKDYQFINICAGFAAIHRLDLGTINSVIIEERLKYSLVSQINEGLRIIGESGYNFLINISDITKGDPPGF